MAGRYASTNVPVREAYFVPNSELNFIKQSIVEMIKKSKEGGNKKGSDFWRKELDHKKFIESITKLTGYDPKEYWENRAPAWDNQADHVEVEENDVKGFYDKVKPNTYVVMATSKGIVKKTSLDKFTNVRRSGIIAINLSKEDSLKWVKLASEGDEIILSTKFGRAIRFMESDVRSMGRTAAGVKGLTLKKDDGVSSFDVLDSKEEMNLLVVMANGYAKQTSLKDYKVQRRGGSGILTAKITEKTGPLVSSHAIINQTELLAISTRGQILKTTIKSIRKAGRATQGVRIMKLKSGDKLVGTVCL